MKNTILYTILFATIFLIITCDNDHGIKPINSNISGTITYTGEWPAKAAEVRLVAANAFPPSDLSDLIIGESIPTTGSEYNYNFYLKPGTYNVLGVAWREEGSTWDILSISGLYFEGTDSLSPGVVELPNENSQVTDIDIHVNRSSAKRITNSKIEGSITFEGAWPDSITEVRVISTTKFSLFPTLQLPTLLDISFSNSIPVESDSAQYVINAYPSRFIATGVLFFKEDQSLSINDILYSSSVGGLSFAPIDIEENETVEGPDFIVKFE